VRHETRRTIVCALVAPVLLALGLSAPGCASLGRLAQLSRVDFHVDRVTDGALAGIPIGRLRRAADLRPTDLLRIADAVRHGRAPLTFDLHVGAVNESENRYDLHLERLEWTLLLEDRETVSGVFEEPIVLDASRTTDIPIAVELDLLRFFDEGANDLVDLALRAAGGGGPTNLKLRARPTVRTPFGPFRFPNEIMIASAEPAAGYKLLAYNHLTQKPVSAGLDPLT
jgi:hypothetical protein